ncbi:unnamed protein product [Blepharisma stoltei]|uniref:Uncharacterized protein n=1 Tax=Blepharisma stoltei TaxID=1481888 RepID=A0AAU9INU2_9CILI|nr:unnamed protein product [Blepharisma stoltei]
MGCCESRANSDFPPRLTPLQSIVQENSIDDPPLKEQSFLTFRVTQLYKKRKWRDLIKMIYSKEPTDIDAVKLKHNQTVPSTIGGLSIAYLAEASKFECNKIHFYIRGILEILIQNLKLGTEEALQENSLLLLSRCVGFFSEGVIHDLLNQKIFELLIPLLGIKELREPAMRTCGMIYKCREKAQRIFFKLKGEEELVKILAIANTEEKVMETLINILYLILDSQNKQSQFCINKIIEAGFLAAIDRIDENFKKSRNYDELLSAILQVRYT